MPSASGTKTTGEIGRNVAVPRSRIRNRGNRAATASRCSSITSRSVASISVGGSSVTWVGIDAAIGSPKSARNFCSSEPYGSAIGIATPIVVVMGPPGLD